MARYGQTELGISDITVDKAWLIETLQGNRQTHHDIFIQACDRFQERAIKELEDVMSRIREGQLPRMVGVQIPIPEEHTSDYDVAIKMLQRHIGDTFSLTEQAYRQLVEDDWGWRDAFASNTSSYLAPPERPRRRNAVGSSGDVMIGSPALA